MPEYMIHVVVEYDMKISAVNYPDAMSEAFKIIREAAGTVKRIDIHEV